MLSVIMQNAVMLSVMAPTWRNLRTNLRKSDQYVRSLRPHQRQVF